MKVIVGCGYLGLRVAQRWLVGGETVAAITRNAERAAELRRQGFEAIVADVTRPQTLSQLPSSNTVLFAVGFDPRSGKSRKQVYVDGLAATLDALPSEPARLILISSTGVYGDAEGSWIDEDSECRPVGEAGIALLAAEELLRHHPFAPHAIILRMAGMYGGRRWPRRAELRAGKPIPARAESWLNLIHVDDAAATIEAAAATARPPCTYVVSDGHPVRRREFFSYLAERLGARPPKFIEPSADFLRTHHSGSNKRVRNTKLLAELKVKLLYPSYKEGIAGQ